MHHSRIAATLNSHLIRPIGLAFALMTLFSALSCSSNYVVARLKIPAGGEILILTDYYYENDRKYTYQVMANGETKVPMTALCVGEDPEKLRFQVVLGKQGDVVAVIENQKPGEVLMLYEPNSGESWPHALPSESFENQKARGLKQLQKLQAEEPATVLKLGDFRCGG